MDLFNPVFGGGGGALFKIFIQKLAWENEGGRVVIM